MNDLTSFVRRFLNRHWPEQAHRLAPPAPGTLYLTKQQRETLAMHSVRCIRLDYRRNVARMVSRTAWSGQEKDSHLPLLVPELPHAPLVIEQVGVGTFSVRADESYWGMPAETFHVVIDGLIDAALDCIRYEEAIAGGVGAIQ